MPITKKGTIEAFHGSWMSGLAELVIDGMPIMCDNGPTGRALCGAFDAAGAGHTINNDAIAGKEVVYSVDDMGMLLGFTPVEEWEGPEIPEEGIEEEYQGGY